MVCQISGWNPRNASHIFFSINFEFLSFLSCMNHSLLNIGYLCRYFVDEVSIGRSVRLVAESLAVRSCSSQLLL